MMEPFGRYTARAKRVLVLAQEEAQRFNHNYLGTEHLLLGLVREEESVGARVLASLGVELTRVRDAVQFTVGRGDQPAPAEIPITPRAKRAMEHAAEEARRLSHVHIGTEHLLLGLLHPQDGGKGQPIAAGILWSFGLTLDQVREAVIEALGNPSGERPVVPVASAEAGPMASPDLPSSATSPASASAAAGPRLGGDTVTIRVDDRTATALDALMEAGVYPTRSEAAAHLLEAGIEASRPMLEQVFAAVAEIRRVRKETQQLARHWQAGDSYESSPPPTTTSEESAGKGQRGEKPDEAPDGAPDTPEAAAGPREPAS